MYATYALEIKEKVMILREGLSGNQCQSAHSSSCYLFLVLGGDQISSHTLHLWFNKTNRVALGECPAISSVVKEISPL